MTPKQRQQKARKQQKSATAYTESREFKRHVERHGYVRASAGPDCLGELTEKGRRTSLNAAHGRLVLDPDGR